MLIIADIGSNHRNSLELALKQIEAAKECGADVAKFQYFTYKELYGMDGKLEYELPKEWLAKLAEHCEKVSIEFLVSAFSAQGVAEVDPFVKRHKVASSEALHYEILDAVQATGKHMIVSTGGLHHSEVNWIIDTYRPSALLECVANYPADPKDHDLNCLPAWHEYAATEAHIYENVPTRQPYRLEVGLSDHTESNAVSLAALGFGATVFERHFDCLDELGATKPTTTPDTPVSLGFYDFINWVALMKQANSAIGDGIKQPRHQHAAMLRYRRRLIVTHDLAVGSKLKAHENYGIFRSLKDDTRGDKTTSLPHYDGKILKVDKKAGDSLWVSDVENACQP